MSAPAAAVPRPRNFYTEPERIDVGGVPVAYRRKGEGEPVLFLHGAGMTRMWLPWQEELSRSVDLIAPEHPGFGETPMPEWLDSFEDLVIHYDELLDLLGLDTVHLVGYSLGGWIAAEFAVYYPKRLRSLTLITPAGLRIADQPLNTFFTQEIEEFWGNVFNDPANLPSILPDYEDLDEVVHQYAEGTTVARLAWEVGYDLALERRLARVTVPALVLRAEHDRLVPDAIAERYAELLPSARIETVPGTGHGLPIEQPGKTAELLAGFVGEVSR
jgi:pimeloyl-ACP methyl ester carboxylesterase